MYLTRNQIGMAYQRLSNIDPDADGKSGKRSTERVSAIRYFLATCAGLHRNLESSLGLDPKTNSENRTFFTQDVGDVVRLERKAVNTGSYTNNFKDESSNITGFGAGNNFLTGSLASNGPYPGRPKHSALIDRNDYTLTLNQSWSVNLSNYGQFDDYAAALAVWLCRFEDLGSEVSDKNGFYLEICKIISNRYGVVVKDRLCHDISAVESLVVDEKGQLILSPTPTEDLCDLAHASIVNKGTEIYPQKPVVSDIVGENVIFYGAPGTGKSYRIAEITQGYEDTQKSRTVFHNEYQNSDFIGALKPVVVKDNITYRFVPGPFTKSFVNALIRPEVPHVLIIEEINRANAAAVFGDIFQLLDRDVKGTSEYSVEPEEEFKAFVLGELTERNKDIVWDQVLRIPNNLSILATMNSADQGVLPMDSAFKRRWSFEYLQLDFSKCPDGTIKHCSDEYSWREFAQAVNSLLASMHVEEDKHLGPWFLNKADLDGGLRAVSGKLFVYLWDDVLRHLPRDKIFDCEGKSFGTIYGDYLKNQKVFSDELLELLQSMQLQESGDDESTSSPIES